MAWNFSLSKALMFSAYSQGFFPTTVRNTSEQLQELGFYVTCGSVGFIYTTNIALYF